MRIKYTKELLAPIVASCCSIFGVVRALGLKHSGGSHSNVKRRIKEFQLDTSHFLGQRHNRGERHVGGYKKKEWQEILVLKPDGARREQAVKLRRALIESGISYVCAVCGLTPEWNGKERRLQVDHINGKYNDNRKDNVRFICPNCHSQTDTYGYNKGKTTVTVRTTCPSIPTAEKSV